MFIAKKNHPTLIPSISDLISLTAWSMNFFSSVTFDIARLPSINIIKIFEKESASTSDFIHF